MAGHVPAIPPRGNHQRLALLRRPAETGIPPATLMSLLAKRIGQITESDLNALVALKVPESRVLDYKRDAVGNRDKDRYEFLADISSFANTSGGELLIGIAESAGTASQICGLNLPNFDQEILRLEQIIRTGTRPNISGIEMRPVPLQNGNQVIVIRIPKSWAAPHQIGQQGSFRFYGRGSNGKYQLDIESLRALFEQGPDLAERIRLFRANRLGKIISNETSVPLLTGSKVIVHIIPIDNFSIGAPVELNRIRDNRSILISLLQYGGQIKVNLDGYIALSTHSGSEIRSYAQLFRNGTIEIVQFVEPWEVHGHNFLPGQAFDEMIQSILAGTKQIYDFLEIRSPIAVMLTLLGMEDRLMGAGKQYGYEGDQKFGKKEIVCPEIIIDDLSANPQQLALPITNLAWNAAGYEQSVFYDKRGNWIGK
jgi:Schlafen, AlbA_2